MSYFPRASGWVIIVELHCEEDLLIDSIVCGYRFLWEGGLGVGCLGVWKRRKLVLMLLLSLPHR